MNKYMNRILLGLLLLLGVALFGCPPGGKNTDARGIQWPPDTILVVKISGTYKVTAPPDTTPREMSLYTSYDPKDMNTTWPPDTIMFIVAPPDTTP